MVRFAAIFFCVLFLSSCNSERPDPEPCGDCPERIVDVALECLPCGVDGPIEIAMENSGDFAVHTDVCSWRIIHVDGGNHRRPFFREVVYTPDCSTEFPAEVEVPPGGTVTMTVEVDPAAIPQLSEYPYIVLELTFRWVDGGVPGSLDLQTGPVEVGMP